MDQIILRIKQLSSSQNWLTKAVYFIILKLYLILKFIINSRYRSEQLTNLFYKQSIHQTSTFTKSNRYPYLFKICYEYVEDNENTKLLSFGCSTGEEVESLRRYFKKSSIYGIDINQYCIKKSKKKFNDPQNHFHHSTSDCFKNISELDAIFCLAVFQKSKNRHNSLINESIYDFLKFENEIKNLDLKLKKGGFLFIDNCDFDFRETSVSNNYKVLNIQNNTIKRNRPAFNRNNKKTAYETNYYRVFQKININ